MRVLQLSHDYAGPFRAVCRQYVQGFGEDDVTTVFIGGRENADVASEVGGEVLFLEQRSSAVRGLKFGVLWRLYRLLRQRRFDVVVAHRYKPIYLAGFLSRLLRIPLVMGVVHEHQVFRRLTRRLLVTFWCPELVLVAVSDSVADDIERDCGPLREAGRLVTLHHAVDHGRQSQILLPERARAALGIPANADRFVFGTIGRLVEKKEHELLLAAFARLRERHPDIDAQLLIVGGGPLADALQQQAAAGGIAGQTVFTGPVDDAWRFIRAFDAFVLPSGEREAFGMVLLEAMLAGVPVVASDAAGPAEVMGGEGLTFTAGDADSLAMRLAEMCRMPAEERAAVAARGHARVEAQFTYARFRERVAGLEGRLQPA